MRAAFLAALFLQAAALQGDERGKWLPPLKTVSLKGEHSVEEVLKALREQTGHPIEAFEVDGAARVKIDWNGRPVLAALDDLCRLLGKGTVKSGPERVEGAEALHVEGDAPFPPGVSHWNQFRVEVEDVMVTTRRSYKGVKRSARVQMKLLWEPGTRPLNVGRFMPEEAVDDTGWSLLMARERHGSSEEFGEGEDPDAVIFEKHCSWPNGQNLALSVKLRAPSPEARSLARLKGRIPITFPMRYLDRKVPAAELVPGKELRIGGLRVRVLRFAQKGQTATLAYRMSMAGSEPEDSAFPDFELLDEKGDLLGRGHSGRGSDEKYEVEYSLIREATVRSLRYRAYLGRYTVVVPVEFKDVALSLRNP